MFVAERAEVIQFCYCLLIINVRSFLVETVKLEKMSTVMEGQLQQVITSGHSTPISKATNDKGTLSELQLAITALARCFCCYVLSRQVQLLVSK